MLPFLALFNNIRILALQNKLLVTGRWTHFNYESFILCIAARKPFQFMISSLNLYISGHISEHLSHPHNWAQLVSAQLFGLQFAAIEPKTVFPPSSGSADTESHGTGYLAEDIVTKVMKKMIMLSMKP